jgi:hypothetical protein
MVRVPDDAVPGSFLRVRLAGKEYNVSLPADIARGESVVVVAPAPSSSSSSSAPVQSAPAAAVPVATDASGFPVPPPTAAPSPAPANGPREINALELRADDTPARYPYKVPAGVPRNVATQVRLAGREFTVKIPDYVRAGEVVTVVAPAAVV